MFYREKRPSTAVFCRNWGLHVRRLGVCGYGYIHGYPWIYPWISTENLWIWMWIWMGISYPRQAWKKGGEERKGENREWEGRRVLHSTFLLRLTHGFANQRLTLTLGLTLRTLFVHAKFWRETMHHKLTRVISRVPS